MYLYVQPTGTRSWIQRLVIRGRKRELGLGSVAAPAAVVQPQGGQRHAQAQACPSEGRSRVHPPPMSDGHPRIGVGPWRPAANRASERCLGETNAVVPWARLMALIEPYYPKAGCGCHPLGLEKMLRIHFVQQWFDLSDPGAEDAIYDSESIRRFVSVGLSEDRIPEGLCLLSAHSTPHVPCAELP